jgi:hypothetical protein
VAFAAVETEREASRRLAQLVAASSGKFQGAFETLESAAGKLTSLRRRVQFAESRVCLSAQLNAALGGGGGGGGGAYAQETASGGVGDRNIKDHCDAIVSKATTVPNDGGGAAAAAEQLTRRLARLDAREAGLERREAGLERREAATSSVVATSASAANHLRLSSSGGQSPSSGDGQVAELEAEIARLQSERAMLLRELRAASGRKDAASQVGLVQVECS